MDRRLPAICLAGIVGLAALFAILNRLAQNLDLNPLYGYVAGLVVYWLLLALAIRRLDAVRQLLIFRAPPRALLCLALAVALFAGVSGVPQRPFSGSEWALIAALALTNGTLEEGFWRGALLPGTAPIPWRDACIAAGLFALWHIAPASGSTGLHIKFGALGLVMAGATMSVLMVLARALGAGAGACATAHVAANLFIFARFLADNG